MMVMRYYRPDMLRTGADNGIIMTVGVLLRALNFLITTSLGGGVKTVHFKKGLIK